MSSNLNKKNNDQKNYNFVYSPMNITNKISTKKENPENPKIISSKDQLAKHYFQNIVNQNKSQNKNNSNSQSVKDKPNINASPNNQFFYKSKILKEANNNHSKNFNDTKSSEHNRSPISLTGRITNLHNIKINKEKIEEEKKKYKGSNINLNFVKNQKGKIELNNILIKSTNLIGHNSKSVNSNNNKNRNIKYGNNLIIKAGNINEGLNNLRKENIYGKKNSYNFNNNNHGIINKMNNNGSKNKKKNEVSNSSNLNLGMLSFSTSNISVNNLIPVSNNINNNQNNTKNNEANNNLNNINIIKNTNISENPEGKNEQKEKNNLNLCLDFISNSNTNTNNVNNNNNIYNEKNDNKLITNANNNHNRDDQTKSADQTTRNPKYFKSESIFNTNYIINFIDSNQTKNDKIDVNNKLTENNQVYLIGQKEIKKNNYTNNAYKELTDITKKNVNEILSKKNTQPNEDNKKEEKKNDENNSCLKNNFVDGKKYKNPEELHFSMIKIRQNINRIRAKF